MMKYSVIIPAFCCEKTLCKTVESVMNAGLTDFEILLIDDGSTDGTPSLCDALVQKYGCIRCIHQANAGVSAARNVGIREAKGEYILFVDSDDFLLPFDSNVLCYLDAEDVDVLIFGMVFQYFHKKKLAKEEKLIVPKEQVYDLAALKDSFADLYSCNYVTPVWNKFFKRSVLTENAVFFDNRLTNYEDLAFSLHALSNCRKVAVVPHAYYLYQVDYDHDHTVDRIAKITDIMGNTDLIAEKFFELEQAMTDGASSHDVRICLLNIYFELFRVKMRTTPLLQIGRYCRDFENDFNVKECLAHLMELPLGNQKLYRWIQKENVLAIWCYNKYLVFRHFVARNVKCMIRRIAP